MCKVCNAMLVTVWIVLLFALNNIRFLLMVQDRVRRKLMNLNRNYRLPWNYRFSGVATILFAKISTDIYTEIVQWHF